MNLVYNELFKVYIRKATWVMYIILFAMIAGFGLIEKTFGDFKNDYGAWEFTTENSGLLMIVGLFTIIVAAGMIAHEFRWGTIKLLLIRPITRVKILFSKYVAVLLFSIFTMLFLIIIAWIVGALAFGVESPQSMMQINTNILTTMDSENVPIFGELISRYGYNMIEIIMMATMAFMISAVFRNSSLAIAVSLFLLMGSSIVVALFANRPFAKYILFAHTDLSMHKTGNFLIEPVSLQFSIIVLLVYYVIFLLLSWLFFTKRDVAGQ